MVPMVEQTFGDLNCLHCTEEYREREKAFFELIWCLGVA